jgi:hypothetical protein
MSSQQLGFIVGRGVSALGVAFLLAYSAHYDWDCLERPFGLARWVPL